MPIPTGEPAFIDAYKTGALKQNMARAERVLKDCTLCPRQCHVDRTSGETGICSTGNRAIVCSYHAHFGEESPLVGENGSGTIFLTYCNLMCSFCQNYEISHGGEGEKVTSDQMAWMMLQLQKKGCHNINFVTPSHVVPQILSAVYDAVQQGLSIPLVYNTGAYDCVETLKLLDGIFDIYMPDIKFIDQAIAEETCDAGDYPEIAQAAVREMYRQVGDLKINASGLAERGLLVRHLVLPDDLAGTRRVMRFLARNISADTYVNIMSQYRPCGRTHEVDRLDRSITGREFEAALAAARDEGIHRLDGRRRGVRFP
jgi:putative pyruvate formate lyase activating enzyme